MCNYHETCIKWLEAQGTLKKFNEAQKQMFIDISAAAQLNPFKREIYATPKFDKETKTFNMSIVIGYEVYLKNAERTGLLDGWEYETSGSVKNNDLKGKIIIYRKDWTHPLKHEVYFVEYNQDNYIWKSKSFTMLKKVAIAQGFRLAFPEHCKDLPYAAEEMDICEIPESPKVNAEIPELPEPEKKPEPVSEEKPKAKKKEAKPEKPTKPEEMTEGDNSRFYEVRRKKLFAMLNENNIKNLDVQKKVVKEYGGAASTKELTEEQWKALFDWIEKYSKMSSEEQIESLINL